MENTPKFPDREDFARAIEQGDDRTVEAMRRRARLATPTDVRKRDDADVEGLAAEQEARRKIGENNSI